MSTMTLSPFAVLTCALAAALSGCAIAQTPTAEPAAAQWRDLFDGRTLEGWQQAGGTAKYRVENGTIVGTTVRGTPNSFLCTDAEFADFEFTYEFRVDPAINSGVQIRSQVTNGKRVRGYQVEIDPSKRSWTAGIYEEGGRGWLDDLADNDPARAALDREGWNRVRVLCEGPRLRTWLNDVPAADLLDAQTATGFIGLQVHSIGAKATPGLEVAWRNLRLRDLAAHTWRPAALAERRYEATEGGDGHQLLPTPAGARAVRFRCEVTGTASESETTVELQIGTARTALAPAKPGEPIRVWIALGAADDDRLVVSVDNRRVAFTGVQASDVRVHVPAGQAMRLTGIEVLRSARGDSAADATRR